MLAEMQQCSRPVTPAELARPATPSEISLAHIRSNNENLGSQRPRMAELLQYSGYEKIQTKTDKLNTEDIDGTSAGPLFKFLDRKASASLDTSEIPNSTPNLGLFYTSKQRTPTSLLTLRPYSAMAISAARESSLRTSKDRNIGMRVKDSALRSIDVVKGNTRRDTGHVTVNDSAEPFQRTDSCTVATFHRRSVVLPDGNFELKPGSTRSTGPLEPQYDMQLWQCSPWPDINSDRKQRPSTSQSSSLRPKVLARGPRDSSSLSTHDIQGAQSLMRISVNATESGSLKNSDIAGARSSSAVFGYAAHFSTGHLSVLERSSAQEGGGGGKKGGGGGRGGRVDAGCYGRERAEWYGDLAWDVSERLEGGLNNFGSTSERMVYAGTYILTLLNYIYIYIYIYILLATFFTLSFIDYIPLTASPYKSH
jgi:hypothetical protein